MADFAPCDFTNHIDIVRQNSKMTSINSAIEIDLTGQIVSDSIGTKFFSGFGGQVDFMAASPHGFDGKGKAIIALPSRTNKNQSKIVPFLTQGSGVVTTRAHARYVVTEHGIAHLWGKSVRQRAYELIKISHPDDRETLEKAAFERFKVMPSP
uniref:AcetylCoA_hyd_C domain-containing protein n=1 Tax=Caenorhabditis japonica TaxID=281687 RepID=A0A8R1HX80_CAEJA